MGFKPFLEGGIAAIIAGALTHPLDLIKVRMQLQGEHSFSLDQNTNHNLDLNLPVKPYRPVFALDSLIGSISLLPSSTPAPSSSRRSSMTPFAVGAHIVKTEGPAALFSGVSATVLRQMLYSATRMGIYDFLKRKWTDRLTGNFPLVTKIAAGLIAGAVGSAVGNPADVAMVRMQADGRLPFHRRRNYKSVVDAIERIVRHEGVSSLWRGSWLTVNRAMIVTASQLATYDHVKEIMIAGGRGTPGGIGTHAAASFAAGIVAAVASNPIDVVKTRMMNAEAESYGGPLDCAVKTVAEEGPMALYKQKQTDLSKVESEGKKMERHCVFIATFLLILHLVQAQDSTGFINVGCGLPPHESPYNALPTGLSYTSDIGLVNTGKTGRIAKEFEPNYTKPLTTLRYFPDGVRNCYTLNVTRDTKYLIMAKFVYGNYDGLKTDPNFDLYFGPNIWTTVSKNDTREEIIHVTKSNSLQVCLVKTGTSIPFINILELRPLRTTAYVTQSGSLKYLFRVYLSNSRLGIRYPDDIYDRAWFPYFDEKSWTQVTTNLTVNITNNYELPQGVAATGATPLNDAETLNITWDVEPPTAKFYTYLHFAELQTLRANDTREFNTTMNGKYSYGPYTPTPLKIETVLDVKPEECDEGACLLQLVRTSKSTLPPLLNAIEAFTEINFPQMETDGDDVYGIKNVQDSYGLDRISWQGDPCVPIQFLWDGLNCDNSDNSTPPIITSLNLSSSGLIGTITQAIQNLTHLEKLDLSNNNLTGEIPEFLADIKSLLVIDLSGNNITGSVPPSVLQKKGMKLNVDNNPHLLCTGGSCVNIGENKPKKNSIIVPVAASIAALAVLIGAFIMFLVLRKKKASKLEDGRSSQQAIMTKNRRFTYSEVMTMTNNFQRVLGKGGFGIVYHGVVNGTEQVAVKILSHSSSQGYKQFKAEVELLLRVHHKNLVGLVGYCDENDKLALIYEYMANGDLKEHMSGTRNRFLLNWGTRLKIVIDSAQGLEYLHNGCTPPMVHRDVKTTNILLNEHFEAKLADFGLSRSFPTEGGTHVSTVVAGTPGYLDPEYYRTNWLTEKSDVYSFGIVLLEIITNRHVIDQSREKAHIAEWVGLMLIKGDIISIMDPSLNGDYDSGSVWKAVELAMSCLNPSSTRRPTMTQVVIGLKECLASENSRGGASRDMDSKSSIEVSMTFDTDVNPTAR